jgi:hypothetical protein
MLRALHSASIGKVRHSLYHCTPDKSLLSRWLSWCPLIAMPTQKVDERTVNASASTDGTQEDTTAPPGLHTLERFQIGDLRAVSDIARGLL